LRYDIQVFTQDGSEEYFFVNHLGEPTVRLAHPNVPGLGPANYRFGTKW
jgi:hypothetical protein